MSYPCPRCKTGTLKKHSKTPGGKQRWVCKDQTGTSRRQGNYRKGSVCYTTTDPTAAVRDQGANDVAPPKHYKRKLRGVRRVLVTAAQNGTPVHGKFLKALETAANHLNAEIVVIPLRYKNPTSKWSKSQENAEVWDPAVAPYLCNERKRLNKNLVLLGDIKVQPTATQPLTGFDAITHGESGILGHTKLQLRSIPTPQNKMPKLLTTTGACTVRNYTDSKAGKLGEFHHTLGACLVEIDGSTFHMRQINADKDTGAFYDLNTIYGADWTRNGLAEGHPPSAVVMGDTHVGSVDPKVLRATKEMIAWLRPDRLVYHDLLDGRSCNPHHLGNVFQAYSKLQKGSNDVRKEVEAACAFVHMLTPADVQAIIVASNHDDFLRRWVISTDWRTDPKNADFYLQTAQAMLRSTKEGPGGMEMESPFAYWLRQLCPRAQVLGGRESLVVAGVELGMHGDRGPNGARGSIKNLRRIGVKSIVGHSHSPGIEEGCYQVGTSTHLNLEYNSGPSSWLNTHALLYPNGKRTLINIIDGQWRLE